MMEEFLKLWNTYQTAVKLFQLGNMMAKNPQLKLPPGVHIVNNKQMMMIGIHIDDCLKKCEEPVRLCMEALKRK